MATTDPSAKPAGSLAEQIAATERRLLNRQQLIGLRRTLLTQHIRDKMTSPVALLVAGGAGFIIGDLTRSKPRQGPDGEPLPRTSPIMEMVDNVVGWVRPIFLAEMGKVMQSFSSAASDQLTAQIRRFSEGAPTEDLEDSSERTA